MIQFDLPIFFKWVVQPPTSYKETSANCNVFEIMYTALLQCSSATVFLVPFHWVSPLSRYVSPNLPGGEVSHPVHHACIGAGGPLHQRFAHASVGRGPPPRMRTHFFKESFRKLPAPGIPGNPPSVLFRKGNERCHDLKSMEIRSVKDACFSKLASFYIVIRFSCFLFIHGSISLFDLHIYIYMLQYCIDTWPGLYTESFVTFSEDMPFCSWFTATDRFAFCRKPVWLSWRRNVVWVLRVCGNWVVSTHMLLKTNTTTVNLPLTCLVSFSVSTSKVRFFCLCLTLPRCIF